jgi:hypothetical protein
MEGEVITKLLEGLRKTAENLPDKRKSSNGRKYETVDFLMSGESCILFSASVHAGFSEGGGREGKAGQSKAAVRSGKHDGPRPLEDRECA